MSEDRNTAAPGGLHGNDENAVTTANGNSGGHLYQTLRKLGGEAYQLHAAVRAADHFLATGRDADRDTGSWLISSAFEMSEELVAELDGLGKQQKERPSEPAAEVSTVRQLRTRAHQLHAASRAADHYMEQESAQDRSTGSWLIAYALRIAEKLAADLDDAASGLKRPAGESSPDFSGLNPPRRPPVTGFRNANV